MVETKPERLKPVYCVCGQMIAWRDGNRIEPLGAEFTLNGKGKPNLICPACGLYTEVKRAMKDGE